MTDTALAAQIYTRTDFLTFTQRPENSDRHFELVNGETLEMVSHGKSSMVAVLISTLITSFACLENDLGRVTGADGDYIVNDDAYIPAVAFMSYARQPEPAYEGGYNVLAPDLAVEVQSLTDDPNRVAIKITNYLLAGTVVWYAHPEKRTIMVYEPGKSPRTLAEDTTLMGGDVLPGFSVPVTRLFTKHREG